MNKTVLTALILVFFSGILVAQVTFQNQAYELGLTHGDDSRGIAIVDLENDGILEIVIVNKYYVNRLYKWNTDSGIYEDLAEEYGIDESIEHHNITIADVDKDLNPDLYITSHIGLPDVRYYLNLGSPPFENVASEYNLDSLFEMGSAFFQLGPETSVSGLLGGRLMIRENDMFVDHTVGSGLETIRNQLVPIFFDIDGDLDDDLYVAGNHEVNIGRLFRNNGDSTFTDISTNTNENGFPVGQSISVADIDNDGDFDFYLTSGFGVNSMWQNDGTGYFTNITEYSNTGYGGYTRGSCFADFDNDCDMDLFLNRGLATNVLLLNDGTGQFVDISEEANVDHVYNGCGSAIGDLNNDGQLDIVATNCDFNPTCVYMNQNENKSFLRVKLVGRRANSLALGAKVKLWGISHDPYDSVLIGYRRVAGLTTLHSVDELTVHFGTGEYNEVSLEVIFASLERVSIPGLMPGYTITVVEPRTDIDDEIIEQLPKDYMLVSSYPNPFNNTTLINTHGFIGGSYKLAIYDAQGRLIKSQELNSDNFIWDGTNYLGETVSSGMYLVKVTSGDQTAVTKLTLLK